MPQSTGKVVGTKLAFFTRFYINHMRRRDGGAGGGGGGFGLLNDFHEVTAYDAVSDYP